MPHYRDGTPAKVGDVVKGKGYNLKDKDGNLREFIGTVVGVVPSSNACNIQVAYIKTVTISTEDMNALTRCYAAFERKGVLGCGPGGGSDGTDRTVAVVDLEYGQCDHFEKIG
jgi:hypothetical protein